MRDTTSFKDCWNILTQRKICLITESIQFFQLCQVVWGSSVFLRLFCSFSTMKRYLDFKHLHLFFYVLLVSPLVPHCEIRLTWRNWRKEISNVNKVISLYNLSVTNKAWPTHLEANISRRGNESSVRSWTIKGCVCVSVNESHIRWEDVIIIMKQCNAKESWL